MMMLDQLNENDRISIVTYAGNAGVRILDVVNRIVIRLRCCDVQIEIEVLVVRAHDIEEPCGVVADFLS